MKNRLLSFLILVLVFWAWYGFYYYFFVMNKWNLTIKSNTPDYTVSLYNEKLRVNFSSDCKNETCKLVDIWPFDYVLTVSKDKYKSVTRNIKIEKKWTLNLDIYLEKELQITKVTNAESITWTWVDIEALKQNATQKLEEMRKQKDLEAKYKLFDFWNYWLYYFEENTDWTLSLYKDFSGEKTKIYTFQKVSASLLDLYYVSNYYNSIFVKYDKKWFIFDIWNWEVEEFDFWVPLNYVKRDNNIFSLVTDNWTYLYNLDDKSIEYFYLFKDFLYYSDDSYFWVIYADEKDKKKNYNLEKESGNLIVKYNFKTKDIKILEKTNINISKILEEGQDIYFYDNTWEKYLVHNIE